MSRGARLTFCELVLPVSESLVFPLPLQRSVLGNIVSFYKSVTVGSSETERTDRGTTREWKHRTDCIESLHMEDTPQRELSVGECF